jgi:hypothetical protein
MTWVNKSLDFVGCYSMLKNMLPSILPLPIGRQALISIEVLTKDDNF